MPKVDVVSDLVNWIERSYHRPELQNVHCLRVSRSVRGPDGCAVSAVSVRHQIPPAAGSPEVFVVELWDVRPGAVDAEDVSRACRQLAGYRAWYAQMQEDAELAGRRRRHRFSLHANVLGTSVGASPLIDLLAQCGGEVAFWTYGTGPDGTRFEPHYAEGADKEESPLARMLDHLPWTNPVVLS